MLTINKRRATGTSQAHISYTGSLPEDTLRQYERDYGAKIVSRQPLVVEGELSDGLLEALLHQLPALVRVDEVLVRRSH